MRTTIQTKNAPAAVGPYSQAVRVSPWVYCAGQIPLAPGSGELVDGDVVVQTRRVLDNLTAVLAAAGCTPADVVKTTVFLTDLGDFAAMNGIYAEVFYEDPPARSTVQVAALPKGASVEIEAVALERTGSASEEVDWTP
jgi:2-iminobutanoate/2-iminopropanoate deaminase